MSVLCIKGVSRLSGYVDIQGSKNAVLPVLAASMLVRQEHIVLKNCPDISDVKDMISLMQHYGVKILRKGSTILVNSSCINENISDTVLFKKTRASVLMLSVLISIFGKVSMPAPGGCVIGKRPVDEHIRVLKEFGADAWEKDDFIEAVYIKRAAADITMRKRSVGATQNAIICAAAINGETVIRNAAVEPEVTALCDFLNLCGAEITYGTGSCIKITGTNKFHSCEYEVEADRIVAGTYAVALAACGGSIIINGFCQHENKPLIRVLKRMGAELEFEGKILKISRNSNQEVKPVNVTADVYPAYPTDLQPQITAAVSKAEGISCVADKVFPERNGICGELIKAGADIRVYPGKILIRGVKKLDAAKFYAGDLRAGAGLCIAALMAEGESTVEGVEFIARGYEDICRDFKGMGAEIFLKQI